ncbi:type II toxin-antitoxin system RelE/ParE family toxin [Lacipirellula sp.]|uniref:type II toxin-antitoxin system RelE/ParE family toxin n=1 Tax=Lacipirellula sp. TaxID=2691419 RepID=UPI003D107F51
MSRLVILSDRAHADLEINCEWWAEHRSAEQAERWYNAFALEIRSLATTAEQHSKASESDRFPFELRQLNFGLGSHPTHRAVYIIRPDMILVLRIQHLSQDALTPDDL